MLQLNVAVICWVLFQVDGKYVERNDSCVRSSDALWTSLSFWNGANLFRKWNVQSVENLAQSCHNDLRDMIEGTYNGSLWAIKMLDASGHYEGNIFGGNEFWLGSNTLCQNLELFRSKMSSNATSMNEEQLYRRTFENRLVIDDNYQTEISSTPPFSVKFAVVKLIFKTNAFCHLANESETSLYVGLCLPSSCDALDVRTTLEWAIAKDVIDVENVRFVPGDYSIWQDTRFYFLSATIFVITLLITLGTSLEYINLKYGKKLDTAYWYRILHAFSIITNLRSICSLEVGEDTLAPIHGLKFISMMWVILVHTCLPLFNVAGNKRFRDRSEEDLLYQTLSNGTYSVDTFFTVSGVLVSFLFFRTVAKYPVKKLVGLDGFLGHTVLYISMLGYRYIRLSFPYLLMVVMAGFLTEQKLNQTPLTMPTNDIINCVDHWWRNALYVNTFYPVSEMCMIWSWYLSNDTQFYVFGVVLLLIALRFRLAALIVGSVCLVLSWITTAIISYRTQYVIDVRDPFGHYEELYNKPWTRVGPYFIGMATGWFLFNIKCNLKVPKKLNIFLWISSLGCMLFIIYGPLYFNSNPIFAVIYASLSHTIWSTAVAWVIIACVTENGSWVNNILSWKYIYPFSRLSYCAYLVHPLMIRMILLSSESAFFISLEIMGVLFLGFLVLSLIFATLLTLAFESPVVALCRLGHPMRRGKQ